MFVLSGHVRWSSLALSTRYRCRRSRCGSHCVAHWKNAAKPSTCAIASRVATSSTSL